MRSPQVRGGVVVCAVDFLVAAVLAVVEELGVEGRGYADEALAHGGVGTRDVAVQLVRAAEAVGPLGAVGAHDLWVRGADVGGFAEEADGFGEPVWGLDLC